MLQVEEVEARDIEVGDDLVNMGEVVDVSGGDDFVVISYIAPNSFCRFVGVSPSIGRTFRDTAPLVRYAKEN